MPCSVGSTGYRLNYFALTCKACDCQPRARYMLHFPMDKSLDKDWLSVPEIAELCNRSRMWGWRQDKRGIDGKRLRGVHGRYRKSKRLWKWIDEQAKESAARGLRTAPLPRYPRYIPGIQNIFKWHREVKLGEAKMPSRDTRRREFERMLLEIADLCGKDWLISLL